MKGFVLVLILLKVLDPTRATKFSDEFDITKALNETIVGVFQSVEPQNIAKLIGNVVNNEVDDSTITYAYNYTWNYGKKITVTRFRNIRITHISSDANNTRISYGILNNKMHLRVYSTQLVVDLYGDVDVGRMGFKYYETFNSTVRFTGSTISALKESNVPGDSLLIDLKFNEININIEGRVLGKAGLSTNFKGMLPSILRTHMNRNEKLLHAFDEIYDNLAMKNIISKHPNFLDHEYLYHYLIPNISIGSVDLRNIVIKGLTHFHSLNFTTNSGTPTYTLLINDIQADMIICVEDTSTLELQYFIESLSISVTQGINHLTVIGENYSVIETGLNTSLTNIRSKLMMDLLARAIGSSLMPSKKYHGNTGSIASLRVLVQETAIKRILIEKLGKRTQKREKTTETAITVTPIPNEKSNNQMQSRGDAATNIYNYYISFKDTTINLLSGNPQYADRMQCESPANSKFTYRVNVLPTGKISLNNNESNTIDVNFHFDYPSVNVSVIKPKSSEGNESCEFQIRNNRDIEIELSPPTGNTNEWNDQLEMKKKIDATLLSMMKNRIIRIIKPIVCLPFNVCTQTVKMVDDFFMEFVDVVLKKCSFRKNTSK